MIEKKLEIVLITYNRYQDLDNTLNEVLKSPFSSCKITVLDNCSDDKTSEVCKKYQKMYPSFNVIVHPKNIGANPNILRAVETSKSLYTWILCDDDHYDFIDCKDVLDAIESEKYDIISLGAPGQQDWEKGLITTSKELFENGSKYFNILSFIPSFIFKTELFDSESMVKGYYNVHNMYPHFPFINKSFDENFSIFTSKKDVIIRGIENTGGMTLIIWIKCWFGSCRLVKEKKIRRKIIYESPSDDDGFITRMIYAITMEKWIIVTLWLCSIYYTITLWPQG
jgi:glycosyltransferase involved in cell wall biosynthesis